MLAARLVKTAMVASTALFALLVATLLSVYKPRGMTRYGQRKQDEQRQGIVQEREDSKTQAVTVN